MNDNTSPRYVPATEVSKLLRQALKEAFPGTRFAVRSGSTSTTGSIDMSWTDGPPPKAVRALTDRFRGSYFDGMIDYQGARYHTLDGERVHLGSDFVSCDRYSSEAAMRAVEGAWAELTQPERVAALAALHEDSSGLMVRWAEEPRGWHHLLTVYDYRPEGSRVTLPSKTAERVVCVGDDGYGAGTVGTPEDRTTHRGYPSAKGRSPGGMSAEPTGDEHGAPR